MLDKSEEFISPFLQGNFAPWPTEDTIDHLTLVQGELPKGLNGTLFRIGPNPQFPQNNKHWFEGDGMIHALTIQQSKVSYRNRWVRTERFNHEKKAGKPLFGTWGDPTTKDPSIKEVPGNTANTNIVQHGGKLLALQETTPPFEINPISLETIGKWSCNGTVPQMSAHPHVDMQSGEMHSYAYTPGLNEVTYYIFDQKCHLIKAEKITIPFSSFMHDFFITKDYVIFPVLPLTFNMERVQQGKPVLMWEPDQGAHIGIMPRSGSQKEIIWYEMEPFYAFHFMNAYQSNGQIILDGMKSEKAHLFPDITGKVVTAAEFPPQLTRWTFDLSNKAYREMKLDDISAEFPRIDERYIGMPYYHGFAAAAVDPKSKNNIFDALVHYNFKKDTQTVLKFGFGNIPSEPVFVPRCKDSDEGDGYLLSIVYNASRDSSDLYVLGALHINKTPLAIVELPHRIPVGFHGNWYDNNC